MNVTFHKRDELLDIAKGIGILSVLLGHLYINKVTTFTYFWHMPIFFFISGILLHNVTDIKSYVSKKFKSLILPYSSTCITVILFQILYDLILGHESFKEIAINAMKWFVAALYASGEVHNYGSFHIKLIGPIWFLPALFWATIIAVIVVKSKHSILACLGLAIVGYISAQKVWLPFSIQSGLLSSLFLVSGIHMRDRVIRYEESVMYKPSYIVKLCGTLLLMIIIGKIYCNFNMWPVYAKNYLPFGL